jgi:ADP-heptose:LPS heptosyltransferase
VVSLLRIGDVIMMAPVLHGLRQKYPAAKIDLLVNDSAKKGAALLSGLNEVITFDRQLLQDGLVQPDRALFEPFDLLKKLVSRLNKNEYNQVINLTQTKASGYICSMVHAESKYGLTINSKNQVSFGSSWFRYLNDYVVTGAKQFFHYIDIFYYGLNLNRGQQKFQLHQSAEGETECDEYLARVGTNSSSSRIVIQALTSDEKKNYSITKWLEAMAQMYRMNDRLEFHLLCAPNEIEQVQTLGDQLTAMGVPNSVAPLSLSGAMALLNRSKLLITGDTSIKHLACGTTASILEIALGSSDYRKTGAYKSDALIIKSRESCSPCDHRKSCHRTEHFCAKSVDPTILASIAVQYVQKNWSQIAILAEECREEIEVLRTRQLATGTWCAQNIIKNDYSSAVTEYANITAWQFLLNKEHLQTLGSYGSESLKLKADLNDTSQTLDNTHVQLTLQRIEADFAKIEARIHRLLANLSKELRAGGNLIDCDFINDEMKREISDIEKQLGLGAALEEKVNIDKSAGLLKARQLQSALNEIFQQQQIKIKLIQGLKYQTSEFL